MHKVIITHEVSEEVKERLRSQAEIQEVFDRKTLLSVVADADAIHGSGSLRVDEELLAAAPKLKMVALASVGYNNFDLEAMRSHGVLGAHTPGVLNDSVADLAIALMIAAARRVCELDRYMREGRWNGSEGKAFFGLEVSGKTLGILGMGRIGQAIARRAVSGMGMKVIYHNRHTNAEAEQKYGAVYVSKEELMEQADFVVIVTPLTEETRGMVGEAEINLMKPTGILVNVARGPVVDSAALAKALSDGVIAGAGIDVFETEPPIPRDHPLFSAPNLVATPHVAFATKEALEKRAVIVFENLAAWLDGAPENVVR